MFRIVGRWLVVALLALTWAGPGAVPAALGDAEMALFAATDSVPDRPEPLPDAQSGGDGEAEPDLETSTASALRHRFSTVPGLSVATAVASSRRAFASYRSQAPPQA